MFEFEFSIIFWTAISFGILLVLLYRVALPPLMDILEKRRQYIENSIRSAEKSKHEADSLLTSYNKKLEEAENHAAAILEQARIESDELRREKVKNAENEVRQLRQLIELEAKAEKKKMVTEVEQHSSDLIIEATQKVLGRVLSKQDQERIINEGINEIKRV